jgi:hypothetical protein
LDSDVLNRFNVTTISHKKQTELPEHEFLVIDTMDNSDKRVRKFVLERITSQQAPGPVTAEFVVDSDTSFLDKVKKFASD